MFVRQMQYLVALAREKHFGRAAEACHVTQPTLSAGIRKLEQELGVPIVVRGHRFLGFTAEGERVLGWARQIAADYESLKQERVETGGRLTGTLRIGAIPAATAAAPALLAPFRDRHPEVKVQMLTLSSVAIQRGLDEMELDAGITYLENEPLNRVRRLDLYLERYVFVTRPDEPLARRRTVRWAEAAAQPLCLLTPDMQNRRIIDHVMAEAGITSQPAIETNSFMGIWSFVRRGPWNVIVPEASFRGLGDTADLVSIPLVEPTHVQPIGLVLSERDPLSPVAAALLKTAKELVRNKSIENSLK
ncbi:transcriptional regulator, LysR family [Ancylobacter novellus DSM 506]|uniref:Transcriptional regulator, LysR family n=1 Tax=Ancylobacter novellus (strain ATCC 8093 / DSM 506 / JCM 20403 / CCM 1077 / IAM 12100 / NBRC 12443 / NCIMB 10456) TaxID=639283 RepID=D7A8L1_ANCN5|nr:LysR family transcriptional regulator [Ancylobacter novellus]ADH90545.1 transcriptional regulator, LysR family [Ancylobacter novellus DSM 506]